jgi:hypothetical protein
VIKQQQENLMPNPQILKSNILTKRRPQTGVQRSKIIGDVSKFYQIQDPTKDKKVNFNGSRSEATFLSAFKRDSKMTNLSRIVSSNPALKTIAKTKAVRPQTAKNYYNQNIEKLKREAKANRDQLFKPKNTHQVREAVITYNEIEKLDKVI